MKAKFINEYRRGYIDPDDSGFVDFEINGYDAQILYKHYTSEDDYDIDEKRNIDMLYLDLFVGLKLGLYLGAIKNGDIEIRYQDVEKLDETTWKLVTQFGEVKLTLDQLEEIANKK